MIHINPEILQTITLTLCVAITIRSMYLRRILCRTRLRLAAAETALDAAGGELEKLRRVEKRFHDFKSDLNQAELSTRMQQSRLEASRRSDDMRTPERYQYVHSLAAKGIEAAEIASILTISRQEADQLVALANLSRR